MLQQRGSDPRLAQLQAQFQQSLNLTKKELKTLGPADAEILSNVDLVQSTVEARYCKSSAGQECSFRVTMRDKQGRMLGGSTGVARRLAVEVVGSTAGPVPVRVVDAGASGMCTASFAPTKADVYEVSVSFLGRPLAATPFHWVVVPGAPAAFGFVERAQEARAGSPFSVRVRGTDALGNPCAKGADGDALRVEIAPVASASEGGAPPQRGDPLRLTTVVMSSSQTGVPSPTAESIWIKDLGDGSYDVHAVLFTRGLYELQAFCRGKACGTAPLRLVLRAGTIVPEACTFEPEAEMFVAGQSLELFIRMMDGYDNVYDAGERPEGVQVTASIVGPDGRDVRPDVQWADEAHVSVAFFPVLAGQYTVTAAVNGSPIKDSPVACFVYATAIFDRNCTVELVDGVSVKTAGEAFEVLVSLRDRYGNSRAGWRDPLTVYVTGSLVVGNEIEIVDEDTGVQRISFFTERSGNLTPLPSAPLAFARAPLRGGPGSGGEQLTGTGLELVVQPGPLDLARSELKCSFKGTSIVAGAQVELSVICRDEFGNTRSETDDRPLLEFACWRNDDPFQFPPFKPIGNGEYKGDPPKRAGKYILSVATAGAELPGSPARWEVLTGAISSKELVLRSGGTTDHRIPLVDPFGNALVMPEQLPELFVDAYGPGLVWPELEPPPPTEGFQPGHHLDLVLRPRALVPGPYVLRIALAGQELPASPFEFRVEPDPQGGRVTAAVVVDEAMTITAGGDLPPGGAGATSDKRLRRRNESNRFPFAGQPPLDQGLLTASVFRPTPLRTTLVLLVAENSGFVQGAWPVLQRALAEGLQLLQTPGCAHVRAAAVAFSDRAAPLDGPAGEALAKEIKVGRPICCLHVAFEACCEAINALRRKFARDLRPGEWDLHVVLAMTGQHSCKETWHVDPADAFSEFRGLTRSAGPARVAGHCLAVGESPDYGWGLLGLEPGAMLCPPLQPAAVADAFARLLTHIALGTGGYPIALELPSATSAGNARVDAFAAGSADGANFLRCTGTVAELPPLGPGGLESRGLLKVLAPTIAGQPNAVLEQSVGVERVVVRNQYVRQTALRGMLLEARARTALREIAVAVMRADVPGDALKRWTALCKDLYKAHGEIDWRPRAPVGAWCEQLLERMRRLLEGVQGTGAAAVSQEAARAARELRREATEVVHGQLLDSGGLAMALVHSAARKGPPAPKENRRGSVTKQRPQAPKSPPG
eukprot:tig00000492_g1479.t1